ncbi:regulatory protein GemA [Desulfotruncus alcoholivorax]|uniref:regulatory protein GemA n=1 Tax=Desulfotruncus alcoholivorax TaxID=265477 RepID=UPI00041DCCA4|nr:regulatory protein GemA [Desulfotruncus alcoholivorax]
MAVVSKAQLRRIWVSAKELEIDEDLIRTIVKNLTGSDSISGLTKSQAGRVIDYLEQRKGNQPGLHMASKQQLWKIQQMAKELGWSDNPKRLMGFVKKNTGIENLNWLAADMAWRVIEGLKKVKQREDRKKDAKG